MKDEQTGKCYALKCFTEEQEGRAEAYRQIAPIVSELANEYDGKLVVGKCDVEDEDEEEEEEED